MSDLNKNNIIPPYFYFNTKYAEWFEDLNNEQAGQAIKSICSYVTLKESPKAEDPAVKIVVTAMKQDIDQSFKKYLAQCENGKKGGAPKGNRNAAKKADVKGSFLSLPIDDIGEHVAEAYYEAILWEAKKTSFDIQKYYKSSQLADLIAIYSVDMIYQFEEFYTEYESLDELTFNTGTSNALKILKKIRCENYEGEKTFSSAFAEYKKRAFDFLELPDQERRKYYDACCYVVDPDSYTDKEIKNIFSSSEFEKLESLVKNNPKTTQNNQI